MTPGQNNPEDLEFAAKIGNGRVVVSTRRTFGMLAISYETGPAIVLRKLPRRPTFYTSNGEDTGYA